MIGFKRWLIKNFADQMSPIGTLAREVERDDTFPGRAVSKYELLYYLKQYHVRRDCYEVFSEAWELYRKEMGITVKYIIKNESWDIAEKEFETFAEAKQEVIELYWESESEHDMFFYDEDEENRYCKEEREKVDEFLYSEEKTFDKYEVIEVYYRGNKRIDSVENLSQFSRIQFFA